MITDAYCQFLDGGAQPPSENTSERPFLGVHKRLPAGIIEITKETFGWTEIKFRLLPLTQLSRLLEHAVIVSQPFMRGNGWERAYDSAPARSHKRIP